MILYDKEGKAYNFDISNDNKIDAGRNAKVYRISDHECLKVMNKDPDNYFNEDIFDLFQRYSRASVR